MVEENNGDITSLDNSDFESTDVPFETLLIPNRPCVNDSLREQVKEWVLTVSLAQRVEQVSFPHYLQFFLHIKVNVLILFKLNSNCHWMNEGYMKPV